MRALKIGLSGVVALVVVALVTLRVTGLEPRYIDPRSEAFVENERTAGPGFWLTGEVVREPVSNWDWVLEVNDPIRGNSIMLETRTWYGIPHSVTVNLVPRGDKLYVSGSEQGSRLQRDFPHSKAWWANIERDPRIRMKIDGKLYEMTVALVADRTEVFQILGRDPVTKVIDADGEEQITGVRHYWRVYQRNIPEYDGG